MNIKSMIYLFIGFILPGLIIVLGALAKVYSPWVYVGSIIWLALSLFMFLSIYKF